MKKLALSLALLIGCAHAPPPPPMSTMAWFLTQAAQVHRVEIVNARELATCWIASVPAEPELDPYPFRDSEDAEEREARSWVHRREFKPFIDHQHDLAMILESVRECLEKIATVY